MRGLLMQRQVRWSAALTGAGLIVQLATLSRVHPLAFMTFLLVGCPLVLAGMVMFLLSLLAQD